MARPINCSSSGSFWKKIITDCVTVTIALSGNYPRICFLFHLLAVCITSSAYYVLIELVVVCSFFNFSVLSTGSVIAFN